LTKSVLASYELLQTFDATPGYNEFGRDIHSSGDVMVVSSGSSTAGSNDVVIFRKVNGVWTRSTSFNDATVPQYGITVFTDGTKVVFHGRKEVNGEYNAGAIYTSVWDGSSWSALSVIDAPNPTENGAYGLELALVGGKLFAYSGFTAIDQYAWNGSGWTFETSITLPAASYIQKYAVHGNHFFVANTFLNSNRGGWHYYLYDGTNMNLVGTYQVSSSHPSNANFGYSMAFDGTTLAIGTNAYNTGSGPYGAVLTYKFDGTSTFTESALIVSHRGVHSNENYARKDIEIHGSKLAIAHPGYDEVGKTDIGAVYIYDEQPDQSWLLSETKFEVDAGNQLYGSGLTLVGDELFVGSNGGVGKVYYYALPPQCTVSADCAGANEYCTTDSSCDSTACTTNMDCDGLFQSNKLPYCKSNGFCSDEFTGTCSTTLECNNKVKNKIAATRNIGVVQQTVTNTNTTQARQTIKSLVNNVYQTDSSTDLVTTISGSETTTFDASLFSTVNDDALLLSEIKAIACGNATELCNIEIVSGGGGGRLLQGGGAITVSITYELDSEVYDQLPEGSFNDPDFIQALADAVGLDAGNVTVVSTGSSFTVQYAVTTESTTDDPLTEDALAAIDDLANDVNTVTSTVVTELGIDESSISATTVDKCADRDCNGRGTCDANTGVCDCTDTSYWGVNCETLIVCENGGTAAAGYCECLYPYYGLRCQTTKDCTC
jgi:hypothetical protein